MKKTQCGAALVVSLVLLTIALMLGVSSMQSSLMDERLASNYRAATQAQMAAEAGISEFVIDGGFSNIENNFEDIDVPGPDDYLNFHTYVSGKEYGSGKADYTIRYAKNSDGNLVVESEGHYGAKGRQAKSTTMGVFALSDTTQPYLGLMTCEGISLSGSSRIDSYDSRKGPYGGSNAWGSEAVVGTQVAGSPIVLTGSSPIYGRVQATGDLRLSGSSSIHGDVTANGDISFEGYSQINGSVATQGSIDINGMVYGDVRAADDIRLSWGSRIQGDATAENIDTPSSNRDNFITGTAREVEGGASVSGVEALGSASGCGDAGVMAYYDDNFADVASACHGNSKKGCELKVSGNSSVMLTAKGLSGDGPHKDSDYRVETRSVNGRDLSVVRFDSLKLGGSADFVVGEPSNPVDMVIIVDDSISMGGAADFKISQGSTLQIVARGELDVGSGIVVGDEKPSKVVDGEVVPILSLISTYHDDNRGKDGVQIGGAAKFYGQVIAPFSKVSVGGSGGLYGAINAREAEISGAGGFHYDESFGEMPALAGGGNENGGLKLIKMYETDN
ncbi:Polymer-forming protein [Modicisalibacter muralis]|uniref:Polymer-forming protein n=1 Tax=Modicisalibacter muralis TaxID=119000 RepID=A0A1G9QL62_9GAMM|nr:PilX N-terminal domain-containing pilus assembly protein [Halomonas muralis]SDM11742.1 Polymer-forming protein [Halomonas muralis]